MEVIRCHDCKCSVSFSAAHCPHCGSKEPAGPYQFSKREARKFRREDKNDNYLVRTTLLIGFLGLLYGIVVGRKSGSESTWYGVQSAVIVMNAALYGFLRCIVRCPSGGNHQHLQNGAAFFNTSLIGAVVPRLRVWLPKVAVKWIESP